jgi:hypothetical protein
MTGCLSIALIVVMGRRGFGVLPRLYVSTIAVAIIMLCQTVVSHDRPFGYLPEILLAILAVIGIMAGLIASLSDTDKDTRHGCFRSLF